MTTHIVSTDLSIQTDEVLFYSRFIPNIPKLKEIMNTTNKEELTIKERYLIQLWVENIQLFIHSHQGDIIEALYNSGILHIVVKLLLNKYFNTSTIVLKCISRILIEFIEMQQQKYTIQLIKECDVLKRMLEVAEYTERKDDVMKTMKPFVVEVLVKIKGDNECFDNLLKDIEINNETMNNMDICHNNIVNHLYDDEELDSEDQTGENSNEPDFYDDDRNDVDDDEEDEDEAITREMQEFFNDIENEPYMIEEML